MELLTTLTLIYVGILVLVLAVGLIMITKYLWVVARILGQVSDGLKVVESNTAPLQSHVETLNGGLSAVSDGLKVVEGHLANAESALAQVGQKRVA